MENISIISIEGNIGSGKSTLLKKIQDWAKENYYSHIYFALEPVDDWNEIRDKSGETILSKFYKDQEKYAFSFQMMAFITRYNKIQELIDEILEKSKIFIVSSSKIVLLKVILVFSGSNLINPPFLLLQPNIKNAQKPIMQKRFIYLICFI